MNEHDDLFDFVTMLAFRTPEMIVLFLGMVVSVANWSKYPRPALLSFLGFGLLLVLVVASEIFFYFFLEKVFDIGLDFMFIENIAAGVRSIISAAAFGLLIFAIYAGRRSPAPGPTRYS